MKYLYFLVVLAFCIAVAIFAGQNTTQVSVNFFTWTTTGSLSLYLILFIAVGMILGVFITMGGMAYGSLKKLLKARKTKKEQKAY